jgi:hypothetical protein
MQVRMKVNDDTREKLGQSTKRNATIPGQGGRESYRGRFVVCLPSAAKQKVGISTCQGLWKIGGRSASHAAVCRASSFTCIICYGSFFIHIFFWFYLPSWLYHQFIDRKYVSLIKILSKFF